MLDGEEKLVTDAIQGKASAFGLLYEYYQPKIFRFIYLKVGHREEAEDLTHQVFLKTWVNIKTYSPRGFPFGSFLYRVARNQVIDHYRTRKELDPLQSTIENAALASSISLQTLETEMAFENIRRVLTSLKPDYQEVIVMKYVEDMTNREIAKALDKSEGAVKLMHNRAIKALKDALN